MSLRLIENMITWQGEGPNTGKRVILLRFKKCDRVENKNHVLIVIPWLK